MPSFVKAAPEKTEAKPLIGPVTNECYLMDSEETKFTLQFNTAFTSCILLNTRCLLYMCVKAEALSKKKNMYKYSSSGEKSILFIDASHLIHF